MAVSTELWRKRLAHILADNAYHANTQGPSVLQLLWQWLVHWWDSLSVHLNTRSLFPWLFYSGIVVIVLLLLWFALSVEWTRRQKSRQSKREKHPTSTDVSIDPLGLADAHLASGELQEAVRWYFQAVLRQLPVEEKKVWQSSYTTGDIVRLAFQNHWPYAHTVSRIGGLCDQIWYNRTSSQELQMASAQQLSSAVHAFLTEELSSTLAEEVPTG